MKSQIGGPKKKTKEGGGGGGTTEDRKTVEEDEVSITEDVRGAEYYHGLVPKADVEPLMKNDGDFLLRKTETNGQIVLALSVRHEGKTRHFMINQDPNEGFYLETHREKTIAELISWHRATKEPLSAASQAVLRRPVERPPWILNHDCIRLGKKLGEGAFGEVYLAEYTEFGGKEKKEVAVKTMREKATREARLKFMKEARLMRKYKHKNVVQFLGVAVHEHPLMIVMEFCPGGSLLSYIRKERGKMAASTKHRFVLEAASGLMYLERQKCIHRDIAARNCLLSSKIELKISDFGMSDDRDFMQDDKLDKVRCQPYAFPTRCLSGAREVARSGDSPDEDLLEQDGRLVVRRARLGDLRRRLGAVPRTQQHPDARQDRRTELPYGDAESEFPNNISFIHPDVPGLSEADRDARPAVLGEGAGETPRLRADPPYTQGA
uniref:Tyrosine-protein kinase n=1 Tax=Steinernema glaseri TaxID=37863 RepID=A0A1I8AHT1_9BILA